MRLKNNAWTFEGVLSKDQCDQIIAYGNDQKAITATTDKFTVNKKRKSEVAWLYDPWIFSMLEPYLHAANLEAGWNFQWEPVEQIQFTKYKKGDYYNWHRDTNIDLTATGNKVRKLSMTVNLNDDYKGGEMYIDAETNYGKKDPQQLKKLQTAGSISVFPSDKWHKVAKVTEGTRYSLVVWFLGEAWK